MRKEEKSKKKITYCKQKKTESEIDEEIKHFNDSMDK